MNFERIDIAGGYKGTGFEGGYTYWISGIYKVVSYRPGEYQAYFIQEWFDNWGDNVGQPPIQNNGQSYYKTRKQAEAAIKRHAKHYTPSTKIVKRAAEILIALREKHND
jgi:hypothetical protein